MNLESGTSYVGTGTVSIPYKFYQIRTGPTGRFCLCGIWSKDAAINKLNCLYLFLVLFLFTFAALCFPCYRDTIWSG